MAYSKSSRKRKKHWRVSSEIDYSGFLSFLGGGSFGLSCLPLSLTTGGGVGFFLSSFSFFWANTTVPPPGAGTTTRAPNNESVIIRKAFFIQLRLHSRTPAISRLCCQSNTCDDRRELRRYSRFCRPAPDTSLQ